MRPDITYVGVTGSCGKTTTTQLIGAVLSARGECRTDAGRLGPGRVTDNLLTIGAASKFCVQELSGSRPGRIRLQTRFLRPQIGVITTVGGDHYKNFRSLEATAREKAELVELLPRHGIAILNADDPHVIAMKHRTRASVITYGLAPEADIRATDVRSAWPDRLSLTVLHGQDRLRLQTRLVGEFWVTSVLAAIACGLSCGIDLKTCASAVAEFEPVFGRASVHSVPDGPAYILETHKAPLWTIANSMTLMRNARAPRKTMVIGTVSDYSGKGSETHRKVARLALDVADRVIFVGPQAGHVSKLRQGDVKDRLFAFVTSYQAAAFLAEDTVAGELIQIKASITDHLERIMLSHLDGVMCWRERCGVERNSCQECKSYRTSHMPPFGLSERDPGSDRSHQRAESEAALSK
jgi:UDP-N-acetylmuramoyl-tripeptide--D-alanyl-D-alanine ligase